VKPLHLIPASLMVVFGAQLAFDAPAAAEPTTGSRLDRVPLSVKAPAKIDQNAAIRTLNGFSRCYARQNKLAARKILALPFAGSEQSDALAKDVGGVEECMGLNTGLTLKAPPPAMIGGMAEQLVLDDYAKADVSAFGSISDEQLDAAGLAPRNGNEDMALCLVRKDPAAARALIDSTPAGEEEAKQVQRFIPHLSECVPQGLTLTLNKSAIRAHTSVALYRLLSNTNEGAALASSARN
jgi:hypothetical protein